MSENKMDNNFDLTKVFDTVRVRESKLFHPLKQIGVKGIVLELFRSYLTENNT